ncbi:MAG TPA: Gfo/Idh/MocA family oxidoreductase, partial [Planctomycetota bacterium]|nr:Gfo/Idh/MocA family oxidoreductase [Planctomycetota bacterium]
LGMVGMWHSHADGIVNRVAENPKEFTLVGFHDPDPEVAADRRKRWEAKIPGFRLFEKPEALLGEKLDGVVVDGQVTGNLKFARMALESGRPVMLEKPAGTGLEEHRALIGLARGKKLHVQMIYLFRYMSAVREMLARARKGEFGKVYEFRARLPKALGDYKRNVAEVSRYKGGIFFEMAGHVIDMMVAILGKPASAAPFLAHHHAAEPASFIDNGVGVFGFEKAWGIVEVPALEVAPHSRRIEVYGTEGACVIPHLGSGHLANRNVQPIEITRGGGAWERIDLPAQTLQIMDLREFAAVAARGKAPDFTMEHDLAVQEALLRSSGMA